MDALLQAGPVDVGDEAGAAGHGDGERLGAAHAAAAGGDAQPAGQRAAEMLAAGLREGLVGALQNALCADVDPRAGRHLAEHHQAAFFQVVEVLLRGPVRHDIAVGQQHTWGVGVRADDADRLARLDEQRFVGRQLLQRGDDGVEGRPVAGGLAAAAVDHEIGGTLGDLGVEVVHQHPHGGLGGPGTASALIAARGADHRNCGLRIADCGFGHAQNLPDASHPERSEGSSVMCETVMMLDSSLRSE